MIKYFFTNSSGILFSRILGFIRDLLSANVLGASIYSDIFFVAFKIPNLFRRIFGEGAFSQTFIPFYSTSKNKIIFTNYVFYKLLFFILVLSILVSLFPNLFAQIFVMGFSQSEKELTAPLIAINFYYLDMIFIIMVLGAMLQYKYHFATSSFSTAILNISIIVSLWLSSKMPPIDVIYNMSFAVLIGGFLQVLMHIIAIRYIGLDRVFRVSLFKIWKKTKDIKEEIKKFNNSFFYSVLGNSTAHISAFIDTWLASFLMSGSISYLYYANRIFQLPMALFSIALSITLFPMITRMLKNNDKQKAFLSIQKGFYFLLFILTFASIIGIIFSKEIIWLLFERGAFTRTDTIMSADILSMYLIGLLPFGLAKIFSTWLYSEKRHKEVAKIATYSLSFNIVFSIILIFPLQAMGLALASSISGIVLFIFIIKAFGIDKIKTFLHNKIMLYYVVFVGISLYVMLLIKTYIVVF